MPGQDRTGPLGEGAMTGRGLGLCGNGIRRGVGRGLGRGCRRGFGFRNQIALTKEEEKKTLESELKTLDLEKQEIERRLSELN
jgi:hypothetical protein